VATSDRLPQGVSHVSSREGVCVDAGLFNGGAWANHIGGGIWTSSGVYTYTASYYDFPTASTLKVENNPGIL